MRGSVLRAIAGAVLGVSFYGNSAHGLDYDVAVAGSIGKKSYVCIVKDDALRVRLERSPGSGKIVSPQSALGKAKRSITNLREKIKSAATKKKKSSLRTKLSGVRETKSELGRCKAGTLPLEVGTDGGDFVLSIPLSALPEGFDPNDIGISTPESIEGAEFTPTPDRIFQLEPSGTTFSEAITVTLRTATGSGGSFGLIHLSLQTSDEAGEHFVVESLEPSTSVEEDESGEERQMLTTVEISSFSSIVKLESELAAPAVALVGVAEEQTVGVPFTAIGRAAYSAAADIQVMKIVDTLPRNSLLPQEIRTDVRTRPASEGWGPDHPYLTADDPITPHQVEYEPPTETLTTELFEWEEQFTCSEATERAMAFTFNFSSQIPVTTYTYFDDEFVEQENGLYYFHGFDETEILRCVEGGGDDDSACKTTPGFSVQCPNASSTTVYLVAFVAPGKGTPTSHELVDGEGEMVSQLCPSSSSEQQTVVDDADVPSSVKDAVGTEPGKTPYWVKVNISGGSGETVSRGLRVFCESE